MLYAKDKPKQIPVENVKTVTLPCSPTLSLPLRAVALNLLFLIVYFRLPLLPLILFSPSLFTHDLSRSPGSHCLRPRRHLH